MRKFALLMIIIMAVLGCTGPYNSYTATIENQSSQVISYKIGGLSENTIAGGASITIDRPADGYLESYDDVKHIAVKKEYLTKGNWKYTFSPRDSYTVKVTNGLTVTAELAAGGWMEGEPFEVASNAIDFTAHGLTIYTPNPDFSVTASNGFPAVAVYNREGDIFKVTLQWSK